jgi:hypothetical protein
MTIAQADAIAKSPLTHTDEELFEALETLAARQTSLATQGDYYSKAIDKLVSHMKARKQPLA